MIPPHPDGPKIEESVGSEAISQLETDELPIDRASTMAPDLASVDPLQVTLAPEAQKAPAGRAAAGRAKGRASAAAGPTPPPGSAAAAEEMVRAMTAGSTPPSSSASMVAAPQPAEVAVPTESRCPKCGVELGSPGASCRRCGTGVEAASELEGLGFGDENPRAATLAPGEDPAENLEFRAGAASTGCQRCGSALSQQDERCLACGAGTAPVIVLVSRTPDGRDGPRSAPLQGTVSIGRRDTTLLFADDVFLSPKHASLEIGPDGISVEDHTSLNGVFVRLTQAMRMGIGDQFIVGQQLLVVAGVALDTATSVDLDGTHMFGSPPPSGELVLEQRSSAGQCQDRYHLPIQGAVIGRNQGEIRFPKDRFVSGQHAKISCDSGRLSLTDLRSSNGTWLRIRRRTQLQLGDELHLGSQVFRIESAED